MKLLIMLSFFSYSLFCETFGNRIISLPAISVDLVDIFTKKDLGFKQQYAIGTSLSYALSYDWYAVSKTMIVFAPLKTNKDLITSWQTFLGFSYASGIKDIRINYSLLLAYWQFLTKSHKNITNINGWPIFIGPKADIGIEWVFIDEFSCKLLANYALYFNLEKPITQSLGFEINLNMYF